jgi:hypothetical protein
MNTYRNPLKINADDPLCSATTLGNTVIGILFEKKGSEIKEALQARIGLVDKKVEEYNLMVGEIEKFLEDKRKILKEMDTYNQDRSDKKRALVTPYQKKLDELHKQYMRRSNELNKQKDKTESEFDKETQSEVGQKAVLFEESFDSFKTKFKELDEFIKKERGQDIKSNPMSGIYSVNSSTTSTGSGISFTNNGNVGIGVNCPSTMLYVSQPTKEDSAVARLCTLRLLLASYTDKIDAIKERIEELNLERRRLVLIQKNIIVDREYKLDLNKLSAFGFEDIEVQ